MNLLGSWYKRYNSNSSRRVMEQLAHFPLCSLPFLSFSKNKSSSFFFPKREDRSQLSWAALTGGRNIFSFPRLQRIAQICSIHDPQICKEYTAKWAHDPPVNTTSLWSRGSPSNPRWDQYLPLEESNLGHPIHGRFRRSPALCWPGSDAHPLAALRLLPPRGGRLLGGLLLPRKQGSTPARSRTRTRRKRGSSRVVTAPRLALSPRAVLLQLWSD